MCKHTSAASSPVSARRVLQRAFRKRGIGGGQVQVCKRTMQQRTPLRRGKSSSVAVFSCCSPKASSLPFPANHSLLLMCPPISVTHEGSTSSKSSLVLTLLLCAEIRALQLQKCSFYSCMSLLFLFLGNCFFFFFGVSVCFIFPSSKQMQMSPPGDNRSTG